MITIARAVDEFEGYIADARRFSERTVRAYRSDLDRFATFWERDFGAGSATSTPLAHVDSLAVRSYLASLHRLGRPAVDATVALDGLRPVVGA